MQRRALGVVPFFFLLAHVAGERSAAAANAQWAPTGSLNYAREDAEAVPLLDGRAFVVGGDRYGSPPTGANSAEIYDPTTKLWTRAASSTLTGLHNAVRMIDGRVLVTNECGLDNFVTVKAYDPNYDAWATLPPINLVHIYGMYGLLADGKVMLAGGTGGCGDAAGNVDLYDPQTNQWLGVGSMAASRSDAILQPLRDGRVLVAGGATDASGSLATSELYDPVTRTWSFGPDMSTKRRNAVAALLPDGRVLVAGGARFEYSVSPQVLASAEIFDPSTNAFTSTASMTVGHSDAIVTTLADGRVMVAAGMDPISFASLAQVDIYDPATGTWHATSPLLTARTRADVVPLPGGKVLVVGGM